MLDREQSDVTLTIYVTQILTNCSIERVEIYPNIIDLAQNLTYVYHNKEGIAAYVRTTNFLLGSKYGFSRQFVLNPDAA